MLRFVEDKLENVYRLFQNSIMITLIFVSYKLEFMKAYSKAFYLVAKTVNKVTHMTWVNEYLVLQLQSKVKVEASRAHLNSEQL